MADTLFTDATATVAGTLVVASFLNDVNTATYDRLTAVAGTNTITATGPLSIAAYVSGQNFYFTPANTNLGAVTLNISSLGPKAITKNGAAALLSGDLLAGMVAAVVYDGTQFQLTNPAGPLNAVDTYVSTGGSTTAYTLAVTSGFGLFTGNAVKLIFNATNTTTTPTLNVAGSGAIAMKVMDANGNKIDPIVGAFAINTPATAVYDGVNWLIIVEYPTGKLLNIQTFTANGTYTPTPGTTSIVVELLGSGGGGGNSAPTGAAQISVGGGGAGGGYARSRYTTGFTPTVAVTIGTSSAGSAGTATSFGALITCAGGGVGGTSTAGASAAVAGGAPGAIAGGTLINLTGSNGYAGVGSSVANVISLTGEGGCSVYGQGGGGGVFSAAGGTGGLSGAGRGSGGSGGGSGASAAGQVGGTGTGGLIVVYEYS